MRHLLKKLKSNREFKVLIFNLLLIIPVVYAGQIYLAYKEYNREFGKHVTGYKTNLAKEKSYDLNEPFQVKDFPTEESLKDYFFKINNSKLYPRLAPGALVYTNGINIDNKQIFPITSFSNKNILFGKESGFWITYKSDEFGFRNPSNTWSIKKPDILFLGDSFTHGAYVKESDTFSGFSRDQGISTINLGIGGTGPLIQIAAYREYIRNSDIRPKILAWVFFAEDIRDLVAEYENSQILRNYLTDKDFSQNFAANKKEIDLLLEKYMYEQYPKLVEEMKLQRQRRKNIIQRTLLKKTLKLTHLRYFFNDIFRSEDNKSMLVKEPKVNLMKELFKKSIDIMNYEANRTDSKLVFIYLPTWVVFGGNEDSYGINTQNPNYLIKDSIFEYVKQQNIPYIDLTNHINKEGNEEAIKFYNYERYGHFTPQGYKSVSEYIYKNLIYYLKKK